MTGVHRHPRQERQTVERAGTLADSAGPAAPEKRPVLGAAWRFVQLGGLAFALNLTITITGHEVLGLPADVAFGAALVPVVFVNFYGFRRFVYRTRAPARRQMLRFLAALIPLRAAEFLAFLALHQLAGIDYVAATVLVLATSAIAKFITFRVWVFAQ